MPKVSQTFGGAYLKAEHLSGRPRVVTVNGYDTETVYGEERYVLYFAGEKRGLLLSPTCANDIAAALGLDEMEEWNGHSVELYPEKRTIPDRDTQTEKLINMIRARAPSSGSPATTLAPPKPAPKPATTARRPDLDNEPPF